MTALVVAAALQGSEPDWRRPLDASSNYLPRWSPGRRLVFDASPAGDDDSSTGAWELWIVNGDGSGRRLTDDQVNDWGPAWSPDGREIAFSRGLNDQYEIYRIAADGSGLRRVTYLVYGRSRAG